MSNNIICNSYPNLSTASGRKSNVNFIYDGLVINNKQKSIGKGQTFFVRTYGCQSNYRDSENIRAILLKLGFLMCNDIKKADVVILNTCAIRENAELKVFGEIGFLKKQKEKNPKFLFGICGCMAQQEKTVNKITKDIKHIDFVVGTHNIHRFPQILNEVITNKKQVIEVWSDQNNVIENMPSIRDHKFKAFVNIMFGCDHFCSYCIVPYTRGKMRFRKQEDIINEIKDLIKQGYKEVTLLGQNVNSYNVSSKTKKYDFANLLQDVADTGISRIRFATSNPWNFNSKIVDVIAKNKNIMPYIHLPIQSGDETILKLMGRPMKIKSYIEKIQYIRKVLPLTAISTDLIVGFPNETSRQFRNTLKLYKKIKFDNAYTFIFSPRFGTPAAKMNDSVSLEVKEKRLAKLNKLVTKYSKRNNRKYLNTVCEVLVDGVSKTNSQYFGGHNKQWKVVNFTGKASVGDIVNVKITHVSKFSLKGKMI